MRFRLFRFKEESISTRNCLKWWSWRALLGIFAFWVLLLIFVPLMIYLLGASSWEEAEPTILNFWKKTFTENIFLPFKAYGLWFWEYISNEPKHTTWSSFFSWKLPMIPGGIFFLYELWLPSKNPYFLAPQTFGDGREANKKDLKSFGLLDGKGLFLGMWSGLKMKLPDTRSVFCIGAPGSGKTAGVVIPAILEGDNTSMIIHDPKGELAKATSGHRAKLGPVFKLNWGAGDDFEKNIRWPSWNPIGGKNLPSLQKGREGYIDTLIYFLIPDGPTGTDPYWVKAGRGCLTGLTGYLCGKVDQARANDYFVARLKEGGLDDEDYTVLLSYYKSMRDFPEVKEAIQNAINKTITLDNYLPIGKWGIIPKSWRGQDASFAMLLDILNNNQMKFTAELKQKKLAGDVTGMMTDPWKMILEEIVLETAYYGYGRRTLLELTQVEALPDKQRGSVISMALSGVNIFKNSAVRMRTSLSDLDYSQIRGIKDKETGEYKPLTIYMSVPLEDIGSSQLISSLFINMVAEHLMEYGPSEGKDGPFPVCFVLDEFQHMPALKSITDGLVFGRSKSNSFLVSVQDWHQINSKYDQETTDIVLSAVAAKIIKRQNNPETRNVLLKGIETLTKVVHSYSRTHAKFIYGKKGAGNIWHDYSHKIKTQADTVLGGSSFLSMAPIKQVVLYSGHLNRPIVAQTPLYFNNKQYKEQTALPPAPPMPKEFIKDNSTELMMIGQMNMDYSDTE